MSLIKFELNVLFVFVCLALSHILACQSNTNNSIFDNEDLNPFINQFFQEAKLHGLDIESKQSELKVKFGNLPKGKAGSCKFKKQLVTIDPTIWSEMDSIQRQALVFHELAHCILNRKHKNSTFQRGECRSLMIDNFSDSTCYYDFYSTAWRNYYLDELFNESQSIPHWYINKHSLKEYSRSDIVLDTTVQNFTFFNLHKISKSQNFLIQIDSISDSKLLGGINCLFETFSINLSQSHLQVISNYDRNGNILGSRVLPRIYHKEGISNKIDQLVLVKNDEYYDLFINGKHVYRNSVDFPSEFINPEFSLSLHSKNRETRLQCSLKVIELTDLHKEEI